MCGLVGIISKTNTGFTKEDIKILKQLIEVNTLRGADSTGLFYVNEFNNIYGIKDNIPGYNFTNTKDCEDIFADIYLSGVAAFAHNRFATLGHKTAENAHPFTKDHICLIHNGTIYNHRKFDNTCNVDSQAITNAFARDGHSKVIPDIDGAYAFIWTDLKENKIFILRNEERPLWVIETNTTFYIGSEARMLDWIVGRNIKLLTKDTNAYFENHYLYSIDLNDRAAGLTRKELPKPEKKTHIISTTKEWPKSTASNTGTINLLDKSFTYGQKVAFIVTSITDIFGKVHINGHLQSEPLIKIKACNVNIHNENHALYCGEILGQQKDRYNQTYLILSNIYPIITIKTIDNQTINIHPNGEYTCTDCGKDITKADSGKIWVRIKNNKAKTFRCPSCTEKHKYITTNEN